MFSWNINFASKLLRDLINLLKELKAEIKERAKMLRYYGVSGKPTGNIYSLRFIGSVFGLGKSKNEAEKYPDHMISEELYDKLHKISELNSVREDLFNGPLEVIFISHTIPRSDRTASELRLFHILKILLKNHCKIYFLHCTRPWNYRKYYKILEGDINYIYMPLNVQDYLKTLAQKSPKLIWITELWQFNYVNSMAKLVAEIKANFPLSKLIVDTIDFHFKEFQRKYELTGNPDDLKRANEFLNKEKVLYRAADIVVVVSEDEKKDIYDKIAGIEKIETLPIVYEVECDTRPYSKREHICFIGYFGNKHNVDAVSYFLESIFDLILEKNPGVEFHVLGHAADKYKHRFESHNVKVVGGVKYLKEALTHYRLFVCPMTYGAGMKGKLAGAVAAGVPVVTTSIGAEGFPFTDGEECFIADSPIEFAEKCNQCLTDTVLWHNFSVKSRLMFAENFSPGVVAGNLRKILSE